MVDPTVPGMHYGQVRRGHRAGTGGGVGGRHARDFGSRMR